jgi:gluconolactonase
MNMKLYIFDSRVCEVGEGPISIGEHNEIVKWVDIMGSRVLSRNLLTGETSELKTKEHVSFIIPCTNEDEILGTANGPILLGKNGRETLLTTRLEADGETSSEPVRWNDAKVAPNGDLFLGSMAYSAAPKMGALYRMRIENGVYTLKKMVSNTTISNGLAWSLDGKRMFYIDTPTLKIESFDFIDGELSNRQTCWQTRSAADGTPDGMCVDSEGGIWVAFWSAGKVMRFDSEFKITDTIDVPTPLTTSVAFAGPNFRTLIITSAISGKSVGPENAGKTFMCEPGVSGLPTLKFPS